MESLEYLLVVDFEACCNEDSSPKPVPQEIIEFPCLLLDVQSKSIKSKFHLYIKPIANPLLTPFCTQLTGITQDMVDKGTQLEHALEQHHQWLIDNHLIDGETHKKIKNWMYLSCGDWDLLTALPKNCAYFKITPKGYFNDWINLKAIFSRKYPGFRGGMTEMLGHLNLPLVGKHHSGIDDCSNILQIVVKLLELDTPFQKTVPHLHSSDCTEGDWFCRCHTHNFLNSPTCRNCGSSQSTHKLSLSKPGDWQCPHCKMNNFAMRLQCYGCGKPIPEEMTRSTQSTQKASLKPGDWQCPQCKMNNFAMRLECYGCGKPIPGEMARSDQSIHKVSVSKPGDWQCPHCKMNNFAMRLECYGCGKAIPDELVRTRPGDWLCAKCQFKNFGRRTHCLQCATPKT